MDHNRSKWIIIDQNGSKWIIMDQNGSELVKLTLIDQNGSEWVKWTLIDQNGSKRSKIFSRFSAYSILIAGLGTEGFSVLFTWTQLLL